MKRSIQRITMACACISFLYAGVSKAGNQHTETFTTTTYKDAVNTTADWNTAAGELRLFPFVPSLVGSYDTPGGAYSLAVDGDLAFVADGTAGLQIVNIANPASPTLVATYDTPDYAFGVAVDGDLAFVADYATGLLILNITSPASPTLVGSYNTPGYARRVAVAGDLAFVADDYAGLQIIDITNPASPTRVGGLDTLGSALGVTIAGDLVFMADFFEGLQIIDITNPASPTLVGSYGTPSYTRGVAVGGDLVFLADDQSGLHIVDITNPANPTLVGIYDTPGYAFSVAVAGDVAFVADNDAGLQIIDITNPASPALVDSHDTPGYATDIAAAGDLVFVADSSPGGLQVIRTSVPVPNAVLVGGCVVYNSRNVDVAGNLAFMADEYAGLHIIDITNPASPTLVGTFDTPGIAFDVAVSGDLALVADDDAGLQVIDVTDPTNPTLIGTCDTPGTAGGVAVAGDLAFVGDGTSGLQIITISNPSSPTIVGTSNAPWVASDVAVAGDLAFVAGGYSGLWIIGITNPASPTLVGRWVTAGSVTDVAVAGDLAFVADGDRGFRIINIANPASPTPLGDHYTLGTAYGIAVAGNFALVAVWEHGIDVFDVSNPTAPTLVSSYSTPWAEVKGVAVAGDLALVAYGNDGLQLIQFMQREVDLDRIIGRSLAVDGTGDVIRRARLSTTETAGVRWYISSNNGANWTAGFPDNVWREFANPGRDLVWYSTHIWSPGVNPTAFDLHLEWLYDYALIGAVTDIANDQGKQVRVEWTRSGHDFIGDATQIVEYAVYRRIDPDLGEASTAASTFEQLSPAARENALMMLAAGWDFITTVPVRVEDSYAVVVPTLKDSTIVAGDYRSTFMVTALTATPGVFFDSPPDSGYSVDNLAPSVPANLAVAYNTGSGNTLSWGDSPDTDFQFFRVYRSTDPNFTPSLGTLVHSTIVNGWVDPGYDGWQVYYKVTALDYAGNESDAATAGSATGIDDSATPRTFALYPNVPNPFNPTTLIRYDIPESGSDVSLRIYDVSGRLVKTLVEGPQTAGEKSVTWNGRDDEGRQVASGVYFYRLAAPNYTKTHKMVLMK